jgi:hypothetical protein
MFDASSFAGVRSPTSATFLHTNMLSRPFVPSRFLRSVYGTGPFIDYCRSRAVGFDQAPSGRLRSEDARRWAAALAELPHDRQARLELELATVNEMAGEEGNRRLLEGAAGGEIPDASVPAGAPLALWFLVNREGLFREVFLRHTTEEPGPWRCGRAAKRLSPSELDAKAAALAAALAAFFRRADGQAWCVAEAHRLSGAVLVLARVGGRLCFLEAFDDEGRAAPRRLRPARTISFLYRDDGAVLLQSHLRSRERVAALLNLFGEAVLGSRVEPDGEAFDLERLKAGFHPLPDAEDMESVRVKELSLRYPAREGRRQVVLQTLATDAPHAIDELLAHHAADGTLPRLRVAHAEIQVRLRVEGGAKSVGVRLWPDRSNLGAGPLADRLRGCLRRWGIATAPY